MAIVGSGTVGPAAGIFLARAGHEVTLFERAPREEAVGAGFLLQPTGLAVLKELGLAEKVLGVTQKIGGLYCETASGRVLLDLKYKELGTDLFGLGTHRSSLLSVLLKAFTDSGGEMRWGSMIEEMSLEGGVRFLNGEGPFDLVLLCDGARSKIRDQSGIEVRVDQVSLGSFVVYWQANPRICCRCALAAGGVDPGTLRISSDRDEAGLLESFLECASG